MRSQLLRSVATATLALCIIAGSAAAQGKGKGKGHDKGDKGEKGKGDDRERGSMSAPVIVGNRDIRVDNEHRDNGRRVPPGLAKKGGLPPGQAKKMYRATDGVVALRDVFGRHGYTVVRTQPYGTRQYVYYRQGTTGLVQRAVIYPGTDRLTFQNVPQLLLQEVLARLY
ncbi:hypothetical protein BH11GEM1_BH11GEM1_34290 [soil metagenome]